MSMVAATKLIRQLSDKMKQKKSDEQKNNSANIALIKKLAQMESAYNASNKQPMPDYDKQLAEAPQIKPVVLKSEQQLMSEAKAQMKKQAEQFQENTSEKAATQVENLYNQQLKAAEKHQEQLDQAAFNFDNSSQKIVNSTIRQGLTHSTIKDAWQSQNLQDYNQEIDAIRQQYDTKVIEYESKIAAVNAAKIQSLAEYNLKQAAECEKILAKLTAEHLKEIESINAYNKKALAQQQQREKQKAALAAQWLKDERQKQTALEEIEKEAGYSGEKQLEMQNRYNTALEFYANLDKKEALRLIDESKADLKKILGLYYDRLIDEISR